ncbi:hypothetical protein PybrP1_009707 [[Pythium] brassicae (nom. inval.)]|nr:hypothetical protein PybrP1_009707 [[Pythium] brassicae (nom. inval.)]
MLAHVALLHRSALRRACVGSVLALPPTTVPAFPPIARPSPRALSTSSSGSEKELTAFQRLNKWLQPFARGSKELYLENKRAWELRSRLRAADGKGVVLSRQEMMVLRQAHRDLLKSLPLLAFFAVPLVGYAAPLLGYQFPKQLLPWQFWRPEQKTAFFSEDARAKAAFYPALVQLLEQMDAKDRALRELLAHEGLNPAQVGELAPFFGPSGPARLDALSAAHVRTLTRAQALFPAFAALTQLLPAAYLLERLAKRADELFVDDQMLLKEGIEPLSLSELEFACFERGIVGGYGDIEALRGALREWLAIYDTDHPDASQLPPSLLLHAPALVRFSEPKTL